MYCSAVIYCLSLLSSDLVKVKGYGGQFVKASSEASTQGYHGNEVKTDILQAESVNNTELLGTSKCLVSRFFS